MTFNDKENTEFTSYELFKHYSKGIDRNSFEYFFDYFDKFYQAYLGKITAGLSPAELQMDIYAWLAQLAQSPGHIMNLYAYPLLHLNELMRSFSSDEDERVKQKDVRFKNEHWQHLPWRLWAESFELAEGWWDLATSHLPGMPNNAQRRVAFIARQMLDAFSPSNFLLTNPELFYQTLNTGGQNLVRGTELAVEHALRRFTGAPPPGADNFIPGKQVAVTPGKVIYKNHLIELIQYKPQTSTVYKEPLLIVPAWIMKYYILDLSPHNSLVDWFVKKGHTVFMISWRNPDENDRNLGMDDYYRLGPMAAIDEISKRYPKVKINLAGYCLGGTLAMITAAAMAKNKDNRLNSLTLLAAQGDFSEAGELMAFVSKSEVAFLKNIMWEQGYLDTKQMAGAFQLLRSYDLIWSKMVQDYMHGRERGMIDLLAWNADSTRMPYKMHSEYLERLFLNNEFSRGKFTVAGKHIAAENITQPAFIVSTEKDHVAPWHSVYKLHLMLKGDVCFVLANGGHNAGIVSEPGHKGRYYRIHETKKNESYTAADNWINMAQKKQGSWWSSYHDWLVSHSAKKKLSSRSLPENLPEAPGTYVMQK